MEVRLLIREVFDAADNQIIGRIRLQKIFYLLEQMGLNSGFKFSYYHYGPYSEQVSKEVDRVSFLDKVILENTRYTVDGNAYSVFDHVIPLDNRPTAIGTIDYTKARDAILAMKQEQSVVIEIAATIHWLCNKEDIADWKPELIKRKGIKASDINIRKALTLLDQIDLAVLEH